MKQIIMLMYLVLTCSRFFADVFYLKDHREINGVIIGYDQDSLTIEYRESDDRKNIVINKSMIEKIDKKLIINKPLFQLMSIEESIEHYKLVNEYKNHNKAYAKYVVFISTGIALTSISILYGTLALGLIPISSLIVFGIYSLISGCIAAVTLGIGLPLLIIGAINIKDAKILKEEPREKLENFENRLLDKNSSISFLTIPL